MWRIQCASQFMCHDYDIMLIAFIISLPSTHHRINNFVNCHSESVWDSALPAQHNSILKCKRVKLKSTFTGEYFRHFQHFQHFHSTFTQTLLHTHFHTFYCHFAHFQRTFIHTLWDKHFHTFYCFFAHFQRIFIAVSHTFAYFCILSHTFTYFHTFYCHFAHFQRIFHPFCTLWYSFSL